MPRDTTGTYTLASGNPVITGTVISTAWANPTMDDLRVAMTDSLSRSGLGGMLAPLKTVNGSTGTPGYTFNTDVDSGFYLAATSDVRVAIANQDIIRFVASGMQFFDQGTATWVPYLSAITIGSQVESVVADGVATNFPFVEVVAGASFYINGGGADRGRLLEGDDYTYDFGTNSINTTFTPPNGAKITAVYTEGTDIDQATTTCVNSSQAAIASAAAALQSEILAGNSEAAAGVSAAAAGVSETNAANSASSASTSATNASNSAAAALASELAAGNSEASAGSDAAAAGVSAAAALASENAAALSETNAATSETNAANSATDAANSAAAAAASAASVPSESTDQENLDHDDVVKWVNPKGVYDAFSQYGLGSNNDAMVAVLDVHDITVSGLYKFISITANSPRPDSYGTIKADFYSAGNCTLYAMTTSPNTQMWIKRQLTNVWYDWEEMATLNNTRSRKNLLMNGGFEVNQRQLPSLTTSNNFFFDRWFHSWDGTQTVTAGFANATEAAEMLAAGGVITPRYVNMAVTTFGAYNGLRQRNEKPENYSGQQLTLSMLAASELSLGLSGIIRVHNTSVSGISQEVYLAGYVTTPEFKKYSWTFDVPDIWNNGGPTPDGTGLFEVEMYMNGTGNIKYTQFQLEFGHTATPFEVLTLAEEYNNCLRHYQVYRDMELFTNSGIAGRDNIEDFMLPIVMRTAPSATFSNITYINGTGIEIRASYDNHVRLNFDTVANGLCSAVFQVELIAEQ